MKTFSTFILIIISSISLCYAAETAKQPQYQLGEQSLYSTYQAMKTQLQNSRFGEPIHLQTQVLNKHTSGDVYGILPYAYELMTNTLIHPGHLCEAIVLHINVKGCVHDTKSQMDSFISLYVGKKEYQHPEDAVKVNYRYSIQDRNDRYTLVTMSADDGPLNTEDIAIHIEFLPINGHESFIHFAYSATYGNLARLALNAYLATLGRNKVGFTPAGVNRLGEVMYIKGIQGVVERNTMRYFFALHSFFDTFHQPETLRFDASLNRWFDFVEKYPRQLYEVPRTDYIEAKHKERSDAHKLQRTAGAS